MTISPNGGSAIPITPTNDQVLGGGSPVVQSPIQAPVTDTGFDPTPVPLPGSVIIPGMPAQLPQHQPQQGDPLPPTDPTTPTDPSTPVPPSDPAQDPNGPGQKPDDTPGKDHGDGGGHFARNLLVGGAILGAGLLGMAAVKTGSRNLEALGAAAASWDARTMHQGGLQAINDANLGARFASGIGLLDKVAVATPIVNRIGSNGRLVTVTRGHLDHAELLASATALRLGDGASVTVHEPLRAQVLADLTAGRSMPSILADLDRSAGGARPAFDNRQVAKYWDRTSMLEPRRSGPSTLGDQVTDAVTYERSNLAIGEDGVLTDAAGSTRIDTLVARRDARLGSGVGLAEGVGTVQGLNVSTLHPAMQARAIEASGVDPALAERFGLPTAYSMRWAQRLGG